MHPAIDHEDLAMSIPDDVSQVHPTDTLASEGLPRRLTSRSSDVHDWHDSKHHGAGNRDTFAALGHGVDDASSFGASRRNAPPGNDLVRIVLGMQQKINALEQQIRSNGSKQYANDESSFDLGNSSHLQKDALLHQKPDLGSRQLPLVAELHEASWSEFMNKFEDAKSEYVIEILVGEPVIRKGPHQYHRVDSSMNRGIMDEMDDPLNSAELDPSSVERIGTAPSRIRINSPQVLAVLATLDKAIDSSAPLVMLRPFKFLIHFEDKIKEIVSSLQGGSPSDKQQLDAIGSPASNDATTLEHMQCLVQFIDHYVKPTVTRLQSNSTKKIAFKDLWYIFQPGEVIFMPLQDRQHRVSVDVFDESPEMLQAGRYERSWRIMSTGGGRETRVSARDQGTRIVQNPFKIHCYYVDYDGARFCPIVHTFAIQPFSGERLITSLDFFPIRLLENTRGSWNQTLESCRMLLAALLTSHTHFFYRGPTLITQPCGCPLLTDGSYQEHVESEVIVDYRTTLLKHPLWRPQASFWRRPPSYPDEIQAKSRMRVWKDSTKSPPARMEVDQIYDDNVIDQEKALIFKDKTRIFDHMPSGWVIGKGDMPEVELCLLATRVYAFVLRTRSFIPLWICGLKKIEAQTDGLHNLQLQDNQSKETIHALVRTHFLRARAAKQSDGDYEVVRGKGKGLVFLLHGAPGVGKTFTAEAVAAANGRPLFQITCGDLGLTPSEVEKALKEIFRYAQLWDCVLLLDECDIFLTQRARADLKRNSLVSILLKVLEYFTGVLFLTTNRVGTLDSAIKSRITMSTYYPALDLAQTKEIWKTNLDLVHKRNPQRGIERKEILSFAREHFQKTIKNKTNWNGRQIHNAFKVAVSLADWEALSHEQQHATNIDVLNGRDLGGMKLTKAHFMLVANASEAFEDYVRGATGKSEEQRAFDAQERDDNYGQMDEPDDDIDTYHGQYPPLKKPRTSSLTAAPMPPQFQHNSSMTWPSPTSPVMQVQSATRNSVTNASVTQSSARRMSNSQHMASTQKGWVNSGTQPRNPAVQLSPQSSKGALHVLASYEQTTHHKRKRSVNGQSTAAHNLRTSPRPPFQDDSPSDSDDVGDDIMNSQAPMQAIVGDDDEEWV